MVDECGLPGGQINLHPGQWKAYNSKKRIVAIIAGSRGGKSSCASCWLLEEMRLRGPGDYLVAAPNYPLIDKAAGPEIRRLFCQQLGLGKMTQHPWQFTLSVRGEDIFWNARQDRQTRILFGHANDPDSLEAMTAKAAWLDECGQAQFRLGSWEAIQRRVSIDKGRIFCSTTPYIFGWFKQLIWDKWKAANGNHPEIDVIQFKSTMNPAFPPEEYERARAALPGWRFRMMYDGLFERPAGQIYDCWDDALNKCPRFAVPREWPRYVGLDFGGVNTAAVFLAEELSPQGTGATGRYFAYKEYHAGGLTAKAHAQQLLGGETQIPRAFGGSKSEGQWRDEFAAGGLPIQVPPVGDVEVGVNRMYGAIASRKLIVFDDLVHTLDDIGSYSREVDESGNPTEKIAEKETHHWCDSCRYVLSYLFGDGTSFAREAMRRATADADGIKPLF